MDDDDDDDDNDDDNNDETECILVVVTAFAVLLLEIDEIEERNIDFSNKFVVCKTFVLKRRAEDDKGLCASDVGCL